LVYGFNFNSSTAQVYFRGQPASVISRQPNLLTVNAPGLSEGPATVEVRNAAPGDCGPLINGYTYYPAGVQLFVTKNSSANAVVLNWNDYAQRSGFRVKRATGPMPASFNPAQHCTTVTGTTYSDSGVLNNGVNLYYLVDTTLACP
jgi:hypothetical protein